MKKLIFLTLLLSVALLFVSCQGDTDTQAEVTTGNKETVAETVTTAELTSEEISTEIIETSQAGEETSIETTETTQIGEETSIETTETTQISEETSIETTETTPVSEETSKEDITTNKTEEDSDKEYSNPDDRYFYRFDSYEQLIDALNDIENSSLRDNIEKYGQYYPKVLDAFENKSIYPFIPCYQDSPFELRVKKGYPTITFMTLDYYDIPWIWYYCMFEEEHFRVQICYLDVLEIPEINSEHTYLDIRYILMPTYPTPDNYTENSDCKNVYEKEITVCGRTVTALINEKINDKAEIGFRIDGMLVIIYGPIDMLTDEFLSSFDLKAV